VAYREEQQSLVAPPKLYGAPAYARPPVLVEESPRPFDPDDLPITASQTDEEREWIGALPARAYAPGGGVVLNAERETRGDESALHPRPFLLRVLSGRLLRSQ
jgi:hypothetical protein